MHDQTLNKESTFSEVQMGNRHFSKAVQSLDSEGGDSVQSV